MKISYRLTLEDWYEAERARFAKERRIRQFAVLAMAGILAAYVGRSRPWVGLLVAFALLATLPIGEWLNRLSFKRAHKRGIENGEQREFTLEISEDGLWSADAPRERWSNFSTFSESANVFVLYRAAMIHAILPKRAFDADDLEAVRRLLKGKLASSSDNCR